MLLIIGADFRKLGVYSKSVTKSHYWKFLVSEGIFKLVCYWEKCRWSNISCASGILVKNIWTDCWIVTVAYLKSSHQKPSVKKVLLKISRIWQENLCWSLFLIKLLVLGPTTFLKRDSNTDVFWWNFWNSFEKSIVNLGFCIFTCNFIYNTWKRYS